MAGIGIALPVFLESSRRFFCGPRGRRPVGFATEFDMDFATCPCQRSRIWSDTRSLSVVSISDIIEMRRTLKYLYNIKKPCHIQPFTTDTPEQSLQQTEEKQTYWLRILMYWFSSTFTNKPSIKLILKLKIKTRKTKNAILFIICFLNTTELSNYDLVFQLNKKEIYFSENESSILWTARLPTAVS